MHIKALKILFFVNGPAPTAEQIVEAEALPTNVSFRNALAVPAENHALEECDGVAGEVPAIYAARFPDAQSAIEARAAKIAALSAKVGDEKAPVKPAAAPSKPKADDKAPTPPAPGWNAPK